MKTKVAVTLILIFLVGLCLLAAPAQHEQDWSNYVRIGAYGLKGGDAVQIVQRAQESGVFGIEVDNDIPGRYESFIHPEEKLAAIRAVAQEAHRVGNYAFVYIAGTECITAHGDQTAHTMAKDHPDWLQRKITGEPAIFGGGTAFWIKKGDEDVWVTPYAREWRKIYMERVRQIAGTGIEEEAVRVGVDVYSLYPVVDAIAHEYEFGDSGHMASERDPLDWFRYQVGMHSFRAFAQGKPTWILNYSWDGDKKVDIRESMMNLAMSQVMAGANFWDAPGHSMAGSNDLPTRKKIFSWIREHEKTFYLPRTPIDPIGVYFSPATRNFHAKEFIASYRGVLILLMQKHLEFQIVTPRTLSDFHGKTLVLPDVRELSDDEKTWVQKFVQQKNRLVITGTDATGLAASDQVVRFPNCPGRAYEQALERDFEHASTASQQEFLDALGKSDVVRIEAPPHIATSIARTPEGLINCFFANFSGLRGGSNPVQIPQIGVKVTVQSKAGEEGYALPFLGTPQPLHGIRNQDSVTFSLPPIAKGAVFWYVSQE